MTNLKRKHLEKDNSEKGNLKNETSGMDTLKNEIWKWKSKKHDKLGNYESEKEQV